jgi:hypothetical protein
MLESCLGKVGVNKTVPYAFFPQIKEKKHGFEVAIGPLAGNNDGQHAAILRFADQALIDGKIRMGVYFASNNQWAVVATMGIAAWDFAPFLSTAFWTDQQIQSRTHPLSVVRPAGATTDFLLGSSPFE